MIVPFKCESLLLITHPILGKVLFIVTWDINETVSPSPLCISVEFALQRTERLCKHFFSVSGEYYYEMFLKCQ